jgi:ABC-type multidrug transport system ATPase subunit
VIETTELFKSFGGRLALAPLTLKVAPGEVVALVGPNGAGKSTTLRVLAGIIRPSGGQAAIGGHDVVGDPVGARRQIGYLSQRSGVPLATVVGDLATLVANIRGLPVREACDAVEQVGVVGRWSSPLESLSGGERQRVLLALATLGPVTTLLLDEPNISLDSEGAEEVRRVIHHASERGTAVLFASHHLSEVARLAQRVLVMVGGRVVAHGSVDHLATLTGIPWDRHAADAPIERIYRALVSRARATGSSSRLSVVRGDAA